MDMLTSTILYLITILDDVDGTLLFLQIASAITALTGVFVGSIWLIDLRGDEKKEFEGKLKKFIVTIAWVFFPSTLIRMLLPDTDQALIIFGIPAAIDQVQNVANSVSNSETATLAMDALKQYLGDYLNTAKLPGS